MRKQQVKVFVEVHWRAPGDRSGVRVVIGTAYVPMTVRHAMHNLPAQYRFWWGGPESAERPVLRILWGWPHEDGWVPVSTYPARSGRQERPLKLTCSRTRLSAMVGRDYVPTGPWRGELVCDPDHEDPHRIVLIAVPKVYGPRTPDRVTIPRPDPALPLPKLELP